jgi:hypothetical protein
VEVARRKCESEGCKRVARNKGIYRGKTRYGRFCEHHHKGEGHAFIAHMIRKIENTACSRCGWDKAPCDRHRVDPKKGYVASNVRVLCPNCHRLEHLGV